ncbi:uncharacterized protein BDV17DRAFT_250557 [Aspergillus undulatus]|uniref:uncharacterized protein n=1 Tax=Aspergillus undulatus TaxID=1810928 RepID=UPI003CCDBED2
MVACVASFRQLFVTVQNQDSYDQFSSRSWANLVRVPSFGFIRAFSDKSSQESSLHDGEQTPSKESVTSLARICVGGSAR